MPAAALTYSDNSDVTIDPSAFASATANIDIQANNDITFQDPVSVRSGVALIAEAAGSILINNRLATSGANLTLNAGSGGIATAAAGDIASDGLVTLNTSGAIGSSGSPLQFDATTTPAAVAIGVTSQPSGIFLYGQGSLTLGNVKGGPACTQIDISAHTNLVVATGATINSGGVAQSQPTGIIGSNGLAPESLATGWDCPSLCLLPDGKVLVVYGNWNNQLDWRISSDGGQTWGAATAFDSVTVPRVSPDGCAVLSDGTILLMTDEWLDSGGDEQSICALRGSYDSGAGTITWSGPSTVAATYYSSAGFAPIQLASGRVLYACYSDSGPAVFYSDDDGATWALLSNICNDGSFSETCLTLMPDGSIIAWIRGESDGDPSPVFTAGGTYTATSSDGGTTWSVPVLRIPSGGDGSSAYGDTAGPASVVRLSSGLTIVMTRCYSDTDSDGYANTCAVYFTQNMQTFSGPFYPDPNWGYWYGTGIQLNGSTALFAYNADIGADVFTVIDPATLDMGTGTISLAADTKADGTGNDGTGTLSIGAGATVVSSNATANAITLRGANIEIDTTGFDMTLGSPVNGGGAAGLTKIGTGCLTLSAVNSYTGGTTVLAGTLRVTVAGALTDDSSLTVGAGGTFVFDPAITASNDTTASTSDTSATTAAPSSTNSALSSLVLLSPPAADTSASDSVAMPGSVSISNSAGDSLVQSFATVATPPVALPLPLASLPQAKALRTGAETSVAFRSAKERDFRGAKGDNTTVIDSPVLIAAMIAQIRSGQA